MVGIGDLEANIGLHSGNAKMVIDPDLDGPSAKALQAWDNESPNSDVATTSATVEPTPVEVKQPDKWVIFEIEGFGEHRAPYHAIIRSGNALVLVYDDRCTGSQKFFPKSADHPIGVHVEGETEAHLVHTTGISFVDGDREYSVMLIAESTQISDEGD